MSRAGFPLTDANILSEYIAAWLIVQVLICEVQGYDLSSLKR